MKTGFSKLFLWVVTPSALLVAGLITVRFSQTSNAAPQTASAPAAQMAAAMPEIPPVAPAPAPQISSPMEKSPAQNALPPNILPGSPLAEAVKLAKAGLDESVIMSYVTNSSGTFNLDSDKIIYLNDTGVPNEVVAMMLQHDQQLQLQMQMAAVSTPQPSSEPAPAPAYTDETVSQPVPEQVTVNYFNNTLTPYGTWVEVAGYGRCWRPTVTIYDTSWQPYCDRGHWVYTDCGWYWSSDYSWGATFHYGRWFRDARFGWCWWPDTVWAPSWVTWRSGNDFCGWAPLPPFAVCQPGAGFLYQGNGVSFSFDFGLAASCYTFVPTANFCDVRLRNHRFGPAQVTQVFNHTTVINNININNHVVFNHGITAQQISKAIGTPIHEMSARELRSTIVHDARNGTFNRPNHTSNAGQNSTGSTASTVTAGHNSSERNHSPANAQQHFSSPANYNSTATADNSGNFTRSQQSVDAQTPRNVARNYAETRQNAVVQRQNQVTPPAVNRSQQIQQAVAQSAHNSNPSRPAQIAEARQNRSEAVAAIQSHVQQQQAAKASASQSDNSSRQDKGQKWPGH